MEDYVVSGQMDAGSRQVVQGFIDTLKSRIDAVKEKDTDIKQFAKDEKVRKKYQFKVDSDLSDFLD